MIRIDPAALYPLARLRNVSWIVGAIGFVLWLIAAFFRPFEAFPAYLFSYVFLLGIPLGGMGWLMIHYLVGGHWGAVVRRPLEAAIGTLPLMAVLFLPVLWGMHTLYPWSRPDMGGVEVATIVQKVGYLNGPFFVIRAILYFACWIATAQLLRRLSAAQDRGEDTQLQLAYVSGPGMVVYGLTMSFAAIDWLMSLEPLWYSTAFGLVIVGGQFIAAMAFAIATLAALVGRSPMREAVRAQDFNDLGNLLLAAVMAWAYVDFSQFLIIWSGNLPHEALHYYHRAAAGWGAIAAGVILFNFCLPFLALLWRGIKRNARPIAILAYVVLAVHLLDKYWQVLPTFHPDGFHLDWLDLVAPIGLVGLWLGTFAWQLARRPLLPLHSTILEGVNEHAG